MPTTGAVYESFVNSVAMTQGELGTPNTIVWEMHIRRLDGAAIQADAEWSLIRAETGHVPAINGEYPVGSPVPAGTEWEQLCRCRSIEYRSGPRGILIVTINWSTMYMRHPDPAEGATTLYFLPSSTDYSSRARTSTLYRTGWTVVPPTTSSNESADIGGTAISGGLLGKAEQVRQVAVRIRVTLDSSVESMANMYSKNFAIVGKRNSATFGGFPAYSLVCEGFSMAKSGNGYEFYDAVFDIVWDEWYHFEQVPTISEAGLPKQNAAYGPDEVKWKRVALGAIDFNDMFKVGSPTPTLDPDYRDITLDGWWPT